MKRKLLLISFAFITVVSCGIQKPVSSITSPNNESYTVDYLFEYDGCKVYRFYDYYARNYVYFTNCSGEVTAVKNDSTRNKILNTTRTEKK